VGSTKKSDLFADVGIKRYSGAEHFIDHAPEWAKTADAARLRGFDLPPYRVEGALFVTDDAGRVAKLQPLALSGAAGASPTSDERLPSWGSPGRLTDEPPAGDWRMRPQPSLSPNLVALTARPLSLHSHPLHSAVILHIGMGFMSPDPLVFSGSHRR
jgi:hypothetical protein